MTIEWFGKSRSGFAPRFFVLHRNRQQYRCSGGGDEVVRLGGREKKPGEMGQEELLEHLRRLLEWRNNDVVKLSLLGPEDEQRVEGLDLSGVVELKRSANGVFEAKFVDKVRVLAMLRELMEERRDSALGEFLDGLYGPEDGDEG